MVNKQINKAGDHKHSKTPNLLQRVGAKRKRLARIYQDTYLRQTGLSVRDPGYSSKVGNDRVKALVKTWPKSLHQQMQLFDTAIDQANLELHQAGLAARAAAGAAAVGAVAV